MQHIEYVYGTDTKCQGFFWPDSDAKRREWLAIKNRCPEKVASVYQCQPVSRSPRDGAT